MIRRRGGCRCLEVMLQHSMTNDHQQLPPHLRREVKLLQAAIRSNPLGTVLARMSGFNSVSPSCVMQRACVGAGNEVIGSWGELVGIIKVGSYTRAPAVPGSAAPHLWMAVTARKALQSKPHGWRCDSLVASCYG